MLKTFNWRMDMGASASTKHRVNKTQFGDGYKQSSKTGINNKLKDWSGTKTGKYNKVIQPIENFLDAHGGYKPFYWTAPDGTTRQYTCAVYNTSQRKGNHWQITLEFEQFNGA